MSFNLVKKSLEKYLKDNVSGVYFTIDSNFSEIETMVNLYSQDTLDPSNNVETQLTGTVSLSGLNVIGIGTLFLTELSVGDSIKVDGQIRVVDEIISDTELNVADAFTSVGVGLDIYKPSNLEFRLLIEVGGVVYPYTTDEDLVGFSISNSIDDVSTVSGWDNNESNILLAQKFDNLVQRYQINELGEQLGTPLEAKMDSWCYIKSPYSVFNSKTKRHMKQKRPRFDLFIKSKNDSNRDNINNIKDEIEKVIMKTGNSIPIYTDETFTTTFSYATFDTKSFTCDDLIDNDSTLQSCMCSFILEYWINYKK